MALQSLSRAGYVKVIGGARPMIIGTRLRTRRNAGLLPHPHSGPEPAGRRRALRPDPHRRWRLHRAKNLRSKNRPSLAEAIAIASGFTTARHQRSGLNQIEPGSAPTA